jgi:hypothetical protein
MEGVDRRICFFSSPPFHILVSYSSDLVSHSLDDIKKLCPQAVIDEGLSVSAFDTNPNDGTRVTTPNRDVTAWVRKTVMAK